MEVKKETTALQAYQKLAALCARSEHCQQEMLDKMRQWGVSDEDQAKVMARLIKEKYVDDERFAHAFVYDKIRYSKWGRRKVEQALMAKRVDREVFLPVLDEVDADEYIAVLRPLLQGKRRQLRGLDDYEVRARLVRFAVGRGFTYDVIRQCVDTDGFEDECGEAEADD